eukprot:8026638-Pyramimonas_sp.AAC.1
MAKRQGKESWFATQRDDCNKCKKMLDSYKEVACEADGTAKKSHTWSLVKYKESVEVSSGVKNYARGRMMWKKQATDFWQTVDGGEMTKDQAKAKWDVESVKAKEDDALWDNDGPEKAPLRIRVHTYDDVDYGSSFKRKKAVDCLGLSIAFGLESRPGACPDDKMDNRFSEWTQSPQYRLAVERFRFIEGSIAAQNRSPSSDHSEALWATLMLSFSGLQGAPVQYSFDASRYPILTWASVVRRSPV